MQIRCEILAPNIESENLQTMSSKAATLTVPNEVQLRSPNSVRTLVRSFENLSTICENPNEPDKQNNVTKKLKSVNSIVKKFELFARSVTQNFQFNDANRLFYCCIIVGLRNNVPYIKYQFPVNVSIALKIEDLCFPDCDDLDLSVKAHDYSILLTNESGERIHGYCRRVLPESSSTCLPLAYCILSKHRAPSFYRKVLDELEAYHGLPDGLRNNLINEFYDNRFPKAGEYIKVNLKEINQYQQVDVCEFRDFLVVDKNLRLCVPNLLEIKREEECNFKEASLKELCETLKVDIVRKVFASLLLERKVIFISQLLSKLSLCIEAVQNTLYPFTWPHTLIPVLPKAIWEIVETPTPLICGMLASSIPEDYEIEDGIVVNLDCKNGNIIKCVGDEANLIPYTSLKKFNKVLSAANKSKNQLLSEAFMAIFVHTCGHYKSHVTRGEFNAEDFVKAPRCKYVRQFLKEFIKTTMFQHFLDSVMENPGSFKIFDNSLKK